MSRFLPEEAAIIPRNSWDRVNERSSSDRVNARRTDLWAIGHLDHELLCYRRHRGLR